MSTDHPLASTIDRFEAHLSEAGRAERSRTNNTPFLRKEYNEVIRAGVEYYRGCQDARGAIVDPDFEEEWHYSTPAFALAAAYLVSRGELRFLSAAVSAIGWGCTSLASGLACQGHGNFYTSNLMKAIDWVRPAVSAKKIGEWYAELRRIDPETTYYFSDHQVSKHEVHNWNLLALAGEYRRFRAGLTRDSSFFDRHIDYHLARLTGHGFYTDGSTAAGNNAHPLAYDLIGRSAFIDLLSEGYVGDRAPLISAALDRGAKTQLFFQDPNGEYACSGRSAGHIWNEAVLAQIAEWAARRFASAEPLLAAAFRRQAQLAVSSMREWYHEPGRFYVVKNRFHPAERQGFEQYTVSTTYNLWALSALALAADNAVESIVPSEIPSERFSFAVDSGTEFHTMVAAHSGLFVAIELAGDPNYNPTGLLRIAKQGIPSQLGPSEGSVAEPRFSSLVPGAYLSHGPAWRDRFSRTHSLAELMATPVIARFHQPYTPETTVTERDDELELSLLWRGGFSGAGSIVLSLLLSEQGVLIRTTVDLPVPPSSSESEWMEARVPLLASDGQHESVFESGEGWIRIRRGRHSVLISVYDGGRPWLDLKPIGSRIGILNQVIIPGKGSVSYAISFEQDSAV
ncbi:MAG: hypothetical protein ACLFNQ_13750 [Spirochaetaceae bacterium]